MLTKNEIEALLEGEALIAELHMTIAIVGITDTARALGVTIPALKKALKGEIPDGMIARARELGMLPPKEEG